MGISGTSGPKFVIYSIGIVTNYFGQDRFSHNICYSCADFDINIWPDAFALLLCDLLNVQNVQKKIQSHASIMDCYPLVGTFPTLVCIPTFSLFERLNVNITVFTRELHRASLTNEKCDLPKCDGPLLEFKRSGITCTPIKLWHIQKNPTPPNVTNPLKFKVSNMKKQ